MRYLGLQQVRQLRVGGVGLDHALNQGGNERLKGRVFAFHDSALHYDIHLVDVPLMEGNKDRAFVGEILIYRPDTYSRGLGYPVGGDVRDSSAFEKFDSRIEHCIDGDLCPLLYWSTANDASFHPASVNGNVSF